MPSSLAISFTPLPSSSSRRTRSRVLIPEMAILRTTLAGSSNRQDAALWRPLSRFESLPRSFNFQGQYKPPRTEHTFASGSRLLGPRPVEPRVRPAGSDQLVVGAGLDHAP